METSLLLSSFPNVRHGFADIHDSASIQNPLLLHQIHSFEVLNPAKINYDIQNPPKADAWVTDKKGFCLTLKTADCAPVLLTDGTIIGAAHAGWKGALTGVIEQTILQMIRLGAQLENISAAIGPCLHKESFIIQADMKNLFSENLNDFFENINGQIHFDFVGYVRYRLQSSGISKIDVIDVNTYQSKDYNSYRRAPEDPFRQYSFIELL